MGAIARGIRPDTASAADAPIYWWEVKYMKYMLIGKISIYIDR